MYRRGFLCSEALTKTSLKKSFKLGSQSSTTGFTLLELLIVIAILAVLATVAVLVINPLEYIKQSRDAKRIADIATLNKALSLAEFENLSLGGASTTVFVSLLDTASTTCGTLGLPPLPIGYIYRCVATSTDLNKVDGNGWVPVNFTALSSKSPLAVLPLDPINNTVAYYTYIPGGSFALSATLESSKYLKQSALADGGTNPVKIEVGSDTKLLTKADGLTGYWDFEEGGGAVVYDKSGYGNNGIWNGTGTHYAPGNIGNSTGRFNGVDDSISLGDSTNVRFGINSFTITGWFKISSFASVACPTCIRFLGKDGWPAKWYVAHIYTDGSIDFGGKDEAGYSFGFNTSSSVINVNNWHQISIVMDKGNAKKIYIYVDGDMKKAGDVSLLGNMDMTGRSFNISPWAPFSGFMDDFRIYNRALSASEIKAIYNATK